FELIRYLRNWDVLESLEQSKRERKQNEGRLYLPNPDADRRYTERFFRGSVFESPVVPPHIKSAYHSLTALLENPLIRPPTPGGQRLWRQQIGPCGGAAGQKYAGEARAGGDAGVRLAQTRRRERVQPQPDDLVRPPPSHVVGWSPYFGAYGLAAVVLIGSVF